MPKVKVGNDNRDGVAGQNTYSAHVGGGSISFDSAGDLYIGTGDDVDPFGQGGNGYAPLDQRYPQRYDARNTSLNTNDLRGKVLRIRPLADAAGRGRRRHDVLDPARATCSPPARRRRSPRSSPWASATRSRSRPTRRGRARSWSATTGRTRRPTPATRGPAGIIEWNRVTKPGFYGWPLCAGDNSAANSYFRYTFPSGPSGTRFDCAAAEIPNESPNNSGLASVPGPAVGADVWHKRTGDHPARFAIPTRSSPQESITGPVYDYDAANPSDTKWPAYYDGAWLILDRAQNWWRETRIKDDGSAMLRVNGMFGTSQFGTPNHTYPLPVKFGPDGSLYLATWGHDCCRAQLPTSQNRAADADRLHRRPGGHHRAGRQRDRRGHAERRRRVPRPRDADARRHRLLRHLARRVLARRHRMDALHGAGRVHHARGVHRALPRHRPGEQHLRGPAGRVHASSPARAACRRSRTSSAARWTRRAGATATRRRRRARAPRASPTASCSCRSAPSRSTWRAPARRRSWPSRCPTGDFTLVSKITARRAQRRHRRRRAAPTRRSA